MWKLTNITPLVQSFHFKRVLFFGKLFTYNHLLISVIDHQLSDGVIAKGRVASCQPSPLPEGKHLYRDICRQNKISLYIITYVYTYALVFKIL